MDMAGHAGLDPADVDVFRALLARPETLAADLDPAAVDRLEALGLVRRGVDGALAALPPHRPLLAEAHRAQSRADALRESAETLRAEFHRRPGAARDAVEVVVGGPEIVGAGVQIARQARRLVRGFDRGPYFHDGSLPDDAQSRSWTRGVPWRVVYEGRSLQAEPPERWEHLGSTPGETGRILPRLPFKLLIADDDAALVPEQDVPVLEVAGRAARTVQAQPQGAAVIRGHALDPLHEFGTGQHHLLHVQPLPFGGGQIGQVAQDAVDDHEILLVGNVSGMVGRGAGAGAATTGP